MIQKENRQQGQVLHERMPLTNLHSWTRLAVPHQVFDQISFVVSNIKSKREEIVTHAIWSVDLNSLWILELYKRDYYLSQRSANKQTL